MGNSSFLLQLQAWNQRWFATHKGKRNKLDLEKANREIEYGMKKAGADPFNESPWRYIVALVQEQHVVLNGALSLESQDIIAKCDMEITKIRQELREVTGENTGVESKELLSAYVDILEMKQSDEGYTAAVDIARSLGKNHDPIRVKYWKLREDEMLSNIQADS